MTRVLLASEILKTIEAGFPASLFSDTDISQPAPRGVCHFCQE